MRIEARQLYRPIGLVDDIVVFAAPAEYRAFAREVAAAAESGAVRVLRVAVDAITETGVDMSDQSPTEISIEVHRDEAHSELFTFLTGDWGEREIFDFDQWLHERNVLRIHGSAEILNLLSDFLVDLSHRGPGYSYLAEFTSPCRYSEKSPEWRLHVEEALPA